MAALSTFLPRSATSATRLASTSPSTATCAPASVCFPIAGGAPVSGGVIYAVALAEGSPYDLLLGSAYAMEDLPFEAALGAKALDDARAAIAPRRGTTTASLTAFPQTKPEALALGSVAGERLTTTCGAAAASAGKPTPLTADIVAVSTQGAFPNVDRRPTRTEDVDRPFVNIAALRDKNSGAYVAMIRMPIR